MGPPIVLQYTAVQLLALLLLTKKNIILGQGEVVVRRLFESLSFILQLFLLRLTVYSWGSRFSHIKISETNLLKATRKN